VEVIAGRGEPTEHTTIVPDRWDKLGLAFLLEELGKTDIDHVVMQFTPLLFNNGRTDSEALLNFWAHCSRNWTTSLVVHETYFRVWWHPQSWIKGTLEKALLRKMVEQAHFVFTASQPLLEEMRRWGSNNSRKSHLLIGSNFPYAEVQRTKARSRFGIPSDEVILLLFGGGNSLKWMTPHVHATDALLRAEGVKASWVLLGGIPDSWFRFRLPVVSPGRLSAEELSFRLQASDVFLMPHYAGLSAKRGTLMAAMQHGLPVIGTETPMTDAMWRQLQGIILHPRRDSIRFSRSVLDLARNGEARLAMGESNQDFFNRFFTWPVIAEAFLTEVLH
jgi:glycosyltransferase involved in cell wall biosynthesis